MKRIRCIFLIMVVFMAMAGTAAASTTLWYNGDFNDSDYSLRTEHVYVNPYGTTYYQSDAKVYDDFIVSAGGWTVDSVWSNNLFTSGVAVSGASYEIRSNVSEGNGGTIVSSGTTDSWTLTSTGRSYGSDYTEYQLLISGLNVQLDQGTYWLCVTPTIAIDDEYAYNSVTSGSNAVGQPSGDNQNSYFYGYTHYGFGSSYFSANFAEQSHDFSMGVAGSGSPVPIPSTLPLLGTGLLALLGCGFRRKK